MGEKGNALPGGAPALEGTPTTEADPDIMPVSTTRGLHADPGDESGYDASLDPQRGDPRSGGGARYAPPDDLGPPGARRSGVPDPTEKDIPAWDALSPERPGARRSEDPGALDPEHALGAEPKVEVPAARFFRPNPKGDGTTE